ncbi:MAG: hypothetical protein QNJ75_04195 [Acidimicrobiia bacterium]|nr:hypothetical protein [Acidimicrobiia bacterium]
MNRRDELLNRVTEANPVSHDAELPDDVVDGRPPLSLIINSKRVPGSDVRPPQSARPYLRWRGPLVAVGTAVAILLVGVASLVFLFAARSEVADQPPASTLAAAEPPFNVLLIGNYLTSGNLGVGAQIEGLAASADPPLTITTKSVEFGTSTLEDHWDVGQALDRIRDGTWDVVVLSENFVGGAETFYEYARKFHEEIEKVGARTVLYMTWRKDLPDAQLTTTLEMIADAHEEIAAELGVVVAPVGLAWQRSIEERPDLALYRDLNRWSPSPAGTSLAAAVLYATIFEQSPVGLSCQPADLIADVRGLEWQAEEWRISETDVEYLQQVAWETVLEYKADQP